MWYLQHWVLVNFCQFTSDPICLLQQVFLVATPISPQTAFSLPLLIFHNKLWNNFHVRALHFTSTLSEWLEPQSELLYAHRKKHIRIPRYSLWKEKLSQ
ncbi:hypothetical protein VP01_663g6 [Puccinia sorghi]|uniref:CxC1-like cysteine cluster associated with KDZ transposases domain-containing protein n=1 Tax=Puccinia sorghi TaxID=27349 RepID=A0A0L6UF15_9BASI|nr:hypothetical protein VP01_663g6 [Puccinia sorghi]